MGETPFDQLAPFALQSFAVVARDPRIRMSEFELDEHMLAMFDSLRVESDEFREEFREGLRSLTNEELRLAKLQDDEIHQAYTRVAEQQSQLLDVRLDEEIGRETYAAKATELCDNAASMALHLEKASRGKYEIINIAVKAFELSQELHSKWLTAEYDAKRRLLEIICLNWTLDDVSLVPTMRKPFDLLAKGLVSKDSRGNRTPVELFSNSVTSTFSDNPMLIKALTSESASSMKFDAQ